MTTKPVASGFTAVMNRRLEPPDSLDFFATPPWSTRALIEFVLGPDRMKDALVWEPAAGEGHMAEVLREYCAEVHASDVFDYGVGYDVGSFVGEGADMARCPFVPDFVITNPPFNLALDFVKRAFKEARQGVAILVRSNWLEGSKRYHELFQDTPPTTVAQFVERVPMVKGRWDPEASTATSYCWVVWNFEQINRHYGWRGMHIPPGQRKALERPDDRRRFAVVREPEPTFADLVEAAEVAE